MITVGNVSSSQVDGASSLSWSHTHDAGIDDVLVVLSMVEDNANGNDMPVTSITYNGVALTHIDDDQTGVGSNDRVEIWYLKKPPSGANTLTINYTGSIEGAIGGAISLHGVNQEAVPDANNGANGNSGTPSVDVTTVRPGALVIDGVVGSSSANALTVDGSQNQQFNVTNAGQIRGAGSSESKAVPGAVTMSWSTTSQLWAMVAASFAPSDALPDRWHAPTNQPIKEKIGVVGY